MSRHEYVKKKQVFCERQEKWAIFERDDLKNSGFDFFWGGCVVFGFAKVKKKRFVLCEVAYRERRVEVSRVIFERFVVVCRV